MYRGTTPNQAFKLFFLLENVDKIYITYSQKGSTVLEKSKDDLTIENFETGSYSIVSFNMSQIESLLFTASENILIQIRIKFLDGTAIASNYMKTNASEILKAGEI